MNQQRFPVDRLTGLFRTQRIATLDELKRALGTEVAMTVFRKLQALGYHTSYSHNGRYYTLNSAADFDQVGLWSFRSVWFSRYGTLVATAEACVEASAA